MPVQVRKVLRLDSNPRAQLAGQAAQLDLAKTEGLGNVEASVISKYAQGGEEEEGEEEDEEEEEESGEEED